MFSLQQWYQQSPPRRTRIADMVLDTLSTDKSFDNKSTPPLKQAHLVSGKIFVVIDNNIVDQLGIDENTWFQQERSENGISLKIRPIVSATSSRCSVAADDT
jgi:hypothetical protein